MPIPFRRFDMQAKQKVLSSLMVVVFTLFTGLAIAAGEQKVTLKADKAGKGACWRQIDLSGFVANRLSAFCR